MSFTVGSLFDGSGGFPLAGALCGGTPVWASEIEPYPIAVTRQRFPQMKHLGSVTDINGAEVEPVDVITFGSPCQDLSVAGKRAGLKHTENGDEETTRSGLFVEAVRIIKEMREATNGKHPTFALWENVPGAFSSNKREDFRIVLEELIKIVEPSAVMPSVPKNGWPYADSYRGDGWSLSYRVLDAQHWGVPQRRRRIYLVLDLRGERAGEVLFKREGLRGYFTEGRTPWQGLTSDAERGSAADDRARECVAYSVQDRAGKPGGGKGMLVQENLSTSLRTSNYQYIFQPVVYDARGNGDGATASTLTGDHQNRITDYTTIVCDPIPIHDQATRFSGKRGDKSDGKGNGLGVGQPGDPMNTLTSGDRHAVAYSFYPQMRAESISFRENVANTLVNGTNPGFQNGVLCMATQQGGAENLCPTITAAAGMSGNNQPVVCFSGEKDMLAYTKQKLGEYKFCDKASTLAARDYKDATDLVCDRVRYIVRRLTPTECARLQGFPDAWGHIPQREDFTEDEYQFWLTVRNTHATVNEKAVKEYTKQQMLTWYNKLWTDSAEYKMWGNGIALPTALYVMQGIADTFN